MKKTISLVVSVVLALAMVAAIPIAAASSEEGTGQNRTVTFNDPDWYTNATVVVPTIFDNSTNNTFTFTVVDDANISWNYSFTMSIYDNNVTWYNESANCTSIALDTNTTNITYLADALPIIDDANVSIVFGWVNGTGVFFPLDWWNGTVDTVDTNNFMLGVTLPSMVASLMGVFIIIALFATVFKSMGKTGKKGRK